MGAGGNNVRRVAATINHEYLQMFPDMVPVLYRKRRLVPTKCYPHTEHVRKREIELFCPYDWRGPMVFSSFNFRITSSKLITIWFPFGNYI